jgi:murein DD-endopeptidase MepM/ murein hydrolase activator NlpD
MDRKRRQEAFSMSTFPLGRPPSVSWHKNPTNTHFGAPRGGGFPVHGACDLIVPPGTEVKAVEDGVIIRIYSFVTYSCQIGGVAHETTTWAMDVSHTRFTARYGEISSIIPEGLRAGVAVTEGQVIATVGSQCGGSMLHFELFDSPGRVGEYLTDVDNKKYLYVPQANYQRRNDLLDPTYLLDRWYTEAPGALWMGSSVPATN